MAISDIVKKSLTPLIYINSVGMAFGGLSLLWMTGSYAWMGFLFLFMSPLIFPFLLLPAGIMTGMLRMVLNAEKPLIEKILTFISVLYLVGILAGYAVMCFYFLVGAPELPAAIYAVTSSVLPWLLFASKDRDNIFFTGLVIMLQFGALVLVALNVAFRLEDFEVKFGIIFGTMLFCVAIEALVERIALNRKKRREGVSASS